jgi:mRNA interferase MazF
MRRGDIWLFDFDPARGSEAAKIRPAVVVSNDGANLAASRTSTGVVTVIPLTTNTHTVYPFQALLTPLETGLPHPSKAQAEQVRALAIGRATRQVGLVRDSTMTRIDSALRVHLAL